MRACGPDQSHYNQSRLWSRLHTTLAQITRITPKWIYTEYIVLNIFLTIQDFWATLSLPWKTEFALKFFTILNIYFTFRIFEQLALALKNRVCPDIFHCIEYMFFTVTCVEVLGWGGTVSFKAKFASIWIQWSSINSPLNWLLAEWLNLLMLCISYLICYTHIGTEAIPDLKNSKI